MRIVLVALVGSVLATAATSPAAADARVEIELVTAPTFPATAQQQWYQLLSELHVDGLQIRKARADDRAAVTVGGAKSSPVYRVVGVLSSAGQLEVPGGKFSQRDRSGLAKWLDKLRKEGPPKKAGESDLPFGLAAKQFAAVNADLATRVAFSSKGLVPAELLDKVSPTLNYSLAVDSTTKQRLARAEPIGDELEGMTSGTALAYVLRSEGLGLLPRAVEGKKPEYAVVKPEAKQTTWPVGWPLEERKPKDLVPRLFETLNAEIDDDIPLTDALDAIGERLKFVVLYDHYALARQGIDLKKVNANFPPRKTWYAKVIDRVLHQSGLNGEWRLDDGGKPFLWVTTLKPVK